jgi:biotin carboxyl carrier protein
MSASDLALDLLDLHRRARDAKSLEAVAILAVNESARIAPYRQAVLWIDGLGMVAASGLSSVETSTPFGLWVSRACRHLFRTQAGACAVEATALDQQEVQDWADWLPRYGLWLPLAYPGGVPMGGILAARDTPWTDLERAFLAELAQGYGHALGWFARNKLRWRRLPASLVAPGRRRWIALVLLGVLALPVPLTVLAPAEIVAARPAVIRSPMDGVVERIHVRPNQTVAQGDPLFSLDDRVLRGKLEITEKTLATAEAEHRMAAQQAVYDQAAKGRVPVLAARMAERKAEAAHLKDLLDRAAVGAPAPGIVVLDDPDHWIGRPVALGERVMSITESHDVEVEAWLAVGDAVELTPGMPVKVFLHADPLNPVSARLRFAGYEAMPRPEGGVAYRLRAELEAEEMPPRLGRKGIARVTAGHVPLVYWLLRRPLAAIRHFVGL